MCEVFKKLILTSQVYFLVLITALCMTAKAQQTTFRISYNMTVSPIGINLPGGIVEAPSGNFVFAGTNASFGTVGNITEINASGNIIPNGSRSYSAGGIATQINDIKNISGGGYIVAGSTGSGCLLMRLDANRNIIWANRYRVASNTSESGNKVIPTSDGGFVIAGSVIDATPAGFARQDSANLFCMKVNSSGTLLWSNVFFISTSFINDHFLNDVAEVADGYIFVGSSSRTAIDDDPSDAIVLKTNFSGNLQWAKRRTGTSSGSGFNAIHAWNSTEVIITGEENSGLTTLRLTNTGAITGTNSRYTNFLNVGIGFNVFRTIDNQVGLIGNYITPLNFTSPINAVIMKVNPSNGNIVFQRFYNAGLSSILPVGIQSVDTGYIAIMTAQQQTGFNYGLIKTDKNGASPNTTSCPDAAAALARNNYTPTLSDITLLTLTGASTIGITPIVANLNPLTTIDCRSVACTAPTKPTVSASSNSICPGSPVTINATGSGGLVFNVFIQSSGGTSIGTTPLSLTPTQTTTYFVEAEDPNNPGCVSARDSVKVTVLPSAPVISNSIIGNLNPCPGNQTYSVVASNNPTNYVWSVTGGSIVSGQGTSLIQVNWAAPGGPNPISVSASNSCGTTTANVSVNVLPGPPQSGSITGNLNPCPGSTTYNVNLPGATSYAWSISGGGTLNGNGSSANVIWNSSGGPFTLSVVGTNSCGSVTASSNITVQNGTPALPGTINGNSPVCFGNATYSVMQDPNATGYTWNLSNGGNISSGQNTNAVVINWTSAGTHTISVTANNLCGNSPPSTLQVEVVSGVPIILGNISGMDTICPGLQAYTIPIVNGATNYTWSVGSAGNITSGQGSNSITVNWANTFGVFDINVVANNICGNSQMTTKNILLLSGVPSAPSLISGNNNPCPGISTYSVSPNPEAFNYQWTLSGGGTISSGQGTTQINIDWQQTGGPYTISVSTENICGASNTVTTLIVNVQAGTPLVPSAVTGDTLVCPGINAYSIPIVNGATSYNWVLSGGGNIVSGQGSNSVNVDWTNSGGPFTLSVVATNNCSSSSPVLTHVRVQNAPPANLGIISGQTTVCNGTELYSVVPIFGADSYTWSISGGGSILNGQSTNNVEVDWTGSPGIFTISVAANNSCGTSSPSLLNVTILPSAPQVPGSITGNINLCQGTENYQIAPVIGATSYNWILSGGGNISSGQNTTAATVNWTTSGTFTIEVTASNSCGNSAAQTLTVTVNASPQAPTVTSGNVSICLGESIFLSANSNDSAVTLNFYDSASGGNLLGSSPISVSPQVTTTFYAEAINNAGCIQADARVPIIVTVNALAATPVVTQSQEIVCLGSSATLTAQSTPPSASITWWDSPSGGNLIATGNPFTTPPLFENQTLYVQSINDNGCSTSTGRTEVEVIVAEDIIVSLESDRIDNRLFLNEVITFTALPDGLTRYDFYLNGTLIQSSTSNVFSSNNFADKDSISVVAFNQSCTANSASEIVNVSGFPNAFTPNGDSKNDKFLEGFDIVILNRWGQELYKGIDGWDGRYEGSKVSPGTYFYILKLSSITENERIVKGTVMVVND